MKLENITRRDTLLTLTWQQLFDLRCQFLDSERGAECCSNLAPPVVELFTETLNNYADWYGDNIDDEPEPALLEWIDSMVSALEACPRILSREFALLGWMMFQASAIPSTTRLGCYLAPVNVHTGDLSLVEIVTKKAPRMTLAGFYTALLDEYHLGNGYSSMHSPRFTEGADE